MCWVLVGVGDWISGWAGAAGVVCASAVGTKSGEPLSSVGPALDSAGAVGGACVACCGSDVSSDLCCVVCGAGAAALLGSGAVGCEPVAVGIDGVAVPSCL